MSFDQIDRKRLAAAELRLQLRGLPDIREPIATKAKWQHKKARKQLDKLEAPIKSYPFRKPMSTQLFAYYVA